jgi:hypothetical protein
MNATKNSDKFKISILIFISFFIKDAYSQDIIQNHKTAFKITIIDHEKQEKIKGILYHANDSSLVVISDIDYYRYKNNLDFQKQIIPFSNMDNILISKKNHFLRSLCFGTFTGVGIGAIVGYTAGDDKSGGLLLFTAKQKALFTGAEGAVNGSIVGVFIGSMQVDIPIHKRYDKFEKKRAF